MEWEEASTLEWETVKRNEVACPLEAKNNPRQKGNPTG